MMDFVVAKYIRLSIEDGVTESMSIPHQRLLLDEHIESLDIPNARVLEFVDNGYSGTNIERPAFGEMLDLVRSGGVNCVIVKDFSRFSRDAVESGYFREQVFPLYRVRFISIGERFDTNDYKGDTGGIDVAFKFLMHEYYSKDLSNKVKSAKLVQMRRGENIVANAVYGYRKNALGNWEPDGEAAEVVREIFSMALNGLPTTRIRDRLFAAGRLTPREYIETRRGKAIEPKCMWTSRMVSHILGNEQYTGTYVAGKQKSKAVGSHSKILTDKTEWIVLPDRHPPIVSKEDYEAVQGIVDRYKCSQTEKPLNNPLLDDDAKARR
jgi:DNA invertase Pin-like site-specific DNA recombinase